MASEPCALSGDADHSPPPCGSALAPFTFLVEGQRLTLPSFDPLPTGPRRVRSRHDLAPGSPFRPLDWRWRLSARRGTPRWAIRDPWLGRLRRFRRAAVRVGSLDDARLDARHGPIAMAYRLSRYRASLLRVELEARLAAGESDEAIADRCGLDPAVVAAFEACHWSVRPWLPNPDRLAIEIVPGGAKTVEAALKLLAIRGGSQVLSAGLDAVRHGLEDSQADEETRYRRRHALATLALLTLPEEAIPPARMLALWRHIRALGRSDSNKTSAPSVPGVSILPWAIPPLLDEVSGASGREGSMTNDVTGPNRRVG